MAIPDPKGETSFQIKRTLRASREKVFEALTTPEALKEWWRPGEGYAVPSAEVDLRVGGAYRIGMKGPGGKVFHLLGTYREIEAPAKLVYTWRWEGLADQSGETLVTLELHDVAGGTELVVTHERFPTEKDRDDHFQGWNGCLDRLQAVLAAA